MRRARPRQFEGAAPEDDTKGELRRDQASQVAAAMLTRLELAHEAKMKKSQS